MKPPMGEKKVSLDLSTEKEVTNPPSSMEGFTFLVAQFVVNILLFILEITQYKLTDAGSLQWPSY